MTYTVTLIPGDGIGPEVASAMRRVVEATGVAVDWEVFDAGEAVIEAYGTPLPEHILTSIRRNRVGIKGPITTQVGKGFRSPNVALRKALDELGRPDIMIVVGGVIPPADVPTLREMGAAAVFGPGTVIAEAALDLLDQLSTALAH